MMLHVEFDRLGRDRDPKPLLVEVADHGPWLLNVRDAVLQHARKHLVSRDLDVFVERETALNGDPLPGNHFRGTVYAGFHVGGEFKGWEVTGE